METARVVAVDPDAAPVVFDLVERLLRELGEEGEETGVLDRPRLVAEWRANAARHIALVAFADDDAAVGVATVAEAFALYATGRYGIINEMYVVPAYRAHGIGAQLVAAVKELGRARGWRRIDVTAPESPSWARTRRFYEREGFTFTGPKLKWLPVDRS